jgi:hypothetical protein
MRSGRRPCSWLTAAGKERVQLDGYPPNNDFAAALMSSLGRMAFARKKYAGMRNDGTVKWSLLRIPIFAPEAISGGGAAVQGDQRSQHPGQSRRVTSKHECVTRLGEQGESVAGLVK